MPGCPETLRCRGSLASLAGILLLSGCGTQEPAARADAEWEAVSSEAPAPPADDSRPVIVAFGDSLTAGHGVAAGDSYPALLQAELDRRDIPFRVVNEGVSGDTTARALSRVDAALGHAPEWVILALGANDGMRGLPLDAMESNLRKMVARFREGGSRVLLAGMLLPRNYGPEYVGQFEAVYPRIAGDLDLPLIPFLLENVAMVRDLNNRDGIHPNRKGNEIIARQVADAFEKAL